jgi:hypothetical protein
MDSRLISMVSQLFGAVKGTSFSTLISRYTVIRPALSASCIFFNDLIRTFLYARRVTSV